MIGGELQAVGAGDDSLQIGAALRNIRLHLRPRLLRILPQRAAEGDDLRMILIHIGHDLPTDVGGRRDLNSGMREKRAFHAAQISFRDQFRASPKRV